MNDLKTSIFYSFVYEGPNDVNVFLSCSFCGTYFLCMAYPKYWSVSLSSQRLVQAFEKVQDIETFNEFQGGLNLSNIKIDSSIFKIRFRSVKQMFQKKSQSPQSHTSSYRLMPHSTPLFLKKEVCFFLKCWFTDLERQFSLEIATSFSGFKPEKLAFYHENNLNIFGTEYEDKESFKIKEFRDWNYCFKRISTN